MTSLYTCLQDRLSVTGKIKTSVEGNSYQLNHFNYLVFMGPSWDKPFNFLLRGMFLYPEPEIFSHETKTIKSDFLHFLLKTQGSNYSPKTLMVVVPKWSKLYTNTEYMHINLLSISYLTKPKSVV